MFFLSPYDFLDIFLRSASGKHQLMAAAPAAQPKIHTHPQDQPFPASAGMIFLHLEHITYADIHCSIPPVPAVFQQTLL